MEDMTKSSKLSNDSHFDIEITKRGIDINRTFCMKQSLTGIRTGSWPDGKIYSLKAHSMLFNSLTHLGIYKTVSTLLYT